MPDDNPTPQNPPAGNPPANPTPPATPPQNPPPGPVPYDRFKEVNDQLAELRQWKAQQEANAKAAQEKQLAEQNKWQELAQQREKELAAERLANTRNRIAMAKGIPADLIDFLQGANETELTAAADRLLAHMKPASGPGVPPPPRSPQPGIADLGKMSAAQVRKAYKPQEAQ